MKFIHTADWQLGMTRHFLQGEAQARFSQARLDAIRSIGQLAVGEGCEFVVVCGDVFESNQVDRRVLTRAFDAMAATPEITFYLLPGNHDPLDAASIYRSSTFREHRPANVHVLEDVGPRAAAEGVELIAAPWTSKRPLVDLVDRAIDSAGPSDAVRIVVGHGALDTRSPDTINPALIGLARLEERIAAAEVHYVALGDRHSVTDEGSTGRVWYAGAPEPTDYVEDDPGNVLIVEIERDQVSVERRHIGTWSFVTHHAELVSDADIESLETWLASVQDPQRTIAKLTLVGGLSMAQKERLNRLLERAGDLLAALESWERRSDFIVLPDDAEIESLGLTGYARAALVDLQGVAGSGGADEAVTAQDAVALLHRLVRSAQ